MTDIKRWETNHENFQMDAVLNGDWVKYIDAKALEDRVKELEKTQETMGALIAAHMVNKRNDEKLITEMMELIEAYRGPYTYVKDSDGFNVSCKEVDELIQRAKKTTGV